MAACRAAWRETAAEVDPARLIFLDESGFDTRLTRTHARAPRGQRARSTAPGGHWERLTLIGALGLDGVCAAMMVAAATGTAVVGIPTRSRIGTRPGLRHAGAHPRAAPHQAGRGAIMG